MTAAPSPRAWAVATALGLESKLDCARWAAGRDGWCGRRSCSSDLNGQCACASPPVPAPWDADAYRADCARRGVEPGPLPSLSWTGPDGFGWSVIALGNGIYVDFMSSGAEVASWSSPTDFIGWHDDALGFTEWHRELVARIVTLATAAKRAMGT